MKPPQVCGRIDILDCTTVKKNHIPMFGGAVFSLQLLLIELLMVGYEKGEMFRLY